MPPTAGEPDPLGLALGRMPSGLFILTARHDGRATGMLVSWVQQAGFAPPMLTVALGRDRPLADWLAATRGFTLNQIRAHQKALLRHFARGFPPDADAFSGLSLLDLPAAGPVLADALAYLDAEVEGEFASGDHRLFLARLTSGALIDPSAEPMVHVRHNGFHY